ncbi:hypothetical protein [Vreelandella nigrificans]|uniref:Uncharacterized protein n=1 Tax=Vreelandella nigrificans TaxID=2042704 RepID=A0A2A4HMI9_9GAMM|nr:hypothetical protein [Halomonas nigrificans]PCF95274.1 hypothetical protein CPA45_13320 [Halomonas nigrificans]
MRRLHHYSALTRLPQMLNSGHLLPIMNGYVEAPLVWFSAHPFWEPTATKPYRTDNALVNLKFWEYRDLFGCIRFALPADDSRLMTWREVCQQVGLSRVDRRKLEAAARKRGGDPKQWFAVPAAIPLADMSLEILSINEWRTVS